MDRPSRQPHDAMVGDEGGSINPAYLQMKNESPVQDMNLQGSDFNLFPNQRDPVEDSRFDDLDSLTENQASSYQHQQYPSGQGNLGSPESHQAYPTSSYSRTNYTTMPSHNHLHTADPLQTMAQETSWNDIPNDPATRSSSQLQYTDLDGLQTQSPFNPGVVPQFKEELIGRGTGDPLSINSGIRPSMSQSRSIHSHRPSSLSLDPSSAQYPGSRLSMSMQGTPQTAQQLSSSNWSSNYDPSFYGHRRHSSNHSNVSSALSSPFVDARSQFDSLSQGASPLLEPNSEDPIVNGIDFGDVSLLDSGSRNPALWSDGSNGIDSFQPSPSYQSPGLQSHLSADYGERGEFRPRSSTNQQPIPQIQVDLAVSTGQPGVADVDDQMRGLSPGSLQDRGRNRSRSDPYLGLSVGDQITGTSSASSMKSGLQPGNPSHGRSISPQDYIRGLISPSPITRKRAVSASSLPVTTESARTQILGLATGESGMGRRAQKHPAKYKCKDCGSAFTRMYNLHSHMRTHTNERPFACNICNKAFARQHDRRRHEQLHSGTRKFVCEVTLHSGQKVGCKRKFARADALGRHFKSEAGKKCIQPLLDEDKQERIMMLAEQHKDFTPEQLAGLVPEPTFGNDGIPDLFRMRMPALSPLPSPRSGQPSPYDSLDEGNFGDDMNQELDAEQIDYMASLEAPTNQDQWVAPPWQGVGVSNYQAQSSHGIPTSLNDPYSSLGPNAAQHQYAQQPGVVSPSDLGGGDFVAGINGMNTAQLLDYGSIPRESTVDSISLPTDQEFLPDLTQQSRARW